MNDRDATVLMIGETLLVLQKFERFLAAVLMAATTPDEVDSKLRKVLLRDKETLGRLMVYFAARIELPTSFAKTFESLLERRNVFVHGLFMQTWFDLSTPAGRTQIEQFMAETRAAMKVALHVMIAASQPRKESNKDADDERRYIDGIITRINQTAEPYFGGLSEEQFREKVVRNARENFTVRRKV